MAKKADPAKIVQQLLSRVNWGKLASTLGPKIAPAALAQIPFVREMGITPDILTSFLQPSNDNGGEDERPAIDIPDGGHWRLVRDMYTKKIDEKLIAAGVERLINDERYGDVAEIVGNALYIAICEEIVSRQQGDSGKVSDAA